MEIPASKSEPKLKDINLRIRSKTRILPPNARVRKHVIIWKEAESITKSFSSTYGKKLTIEAFTLIEKNHVNIIVMGHQTKNTFGRWLLGSTPDKVVHHAPCTVTIVKNNHYAK